MRILMILALVAASFGARQALAFPLPTYVTFTPYAASIAVTNSYGVPVACVTTVQAQRNDGFVQWSTVNFGFIPYGLTQYGYVYTNAPFFYVGAYAWSDCGYLY